MQVIDQNQKNAPMKTMNKKMSNYFSIGIDARIGIGDKFNYKLTNNLTNNNIELLLCFFHISKNILQGFDRHRSNNACCNKVVYCCEGFKKLFLKTPKIKNVIDSLEVLHEQDVESQEVLNKKLINTLILYSIHIWKLI